tara:strand:+ start:576 stop:935 length:360 start_codon:yes stop_codon:yes gene_type:complete
MEELNLKKIPKLYTVAETCKILGLQVDSQNLRMIKRQIKKSRIEYYLIGRNIVLSKMQIQAFLKQAKRGGGLSLRYLKDIGTQTNPGGILEEHFDYQKKKQSKYTNLQDAINEKMQKNI